MAQCREQPSGTGSPPTTWVLRVELIFRLGGKSPYLLSPHWTQSGILLTVLRMKIEGLPCGGGSKDEQPQALAAPGSPLPTPKAKGLKWWEGGFQQPNIVIQIPAP